MRKRNSQLNIRLTKEELQRLKQNAAKANYSVSNYLRTLINGNAPRECPPIEYDRLMRYLQKSISIFSDIRDAVRFGSDEDNPDFAALDARMQDELSHLYTTLLELQYAMQEPDKAVL